MPEGNCFHSQYNTETYNYTDTQSIQITLVSYVCPKWTDMDPNRHSFILLQNHCSQLGQLSADTTLTGKGVFLRVLPFSQHLSPSQQLTLLQHSDKNSLALDFSFIGAGCKYIFCEGRQMNASSLLPAFLPWVYLESVYQC